MAKYTVFACTVGPIDEGIACFRQARTQSQPVFSSSVDGIDFVFGCHLQSAKRSGSLAASIETFFCCSVVRR